MLLLLLSLLALTMASNAKRKPTREQPHVVLEGRHLNTFEAAEFHNDPRFVSRGDDALQQFIVQLKEPAAQSRLQIGTTNVYLFVFVCLYLLFVFQNDDSQKRFKF